MTETHTLLDLPGSLRSNSIQDPNEIFAILQDPDVLADLAKNHKYFDRKWDGQLTDQIIQDIATIYGWIKDIEFDKVKDFQNRNTIDHPLYRIINLGRQIYWIQAKYPIFEKEKIIKLFCYFSGKVESDSILREYIKGSNFSLPLNIAQVKLLLLPGLDNKFNYIDFKLKEEREYFEFTSYELISNNLSGINTVLTDNFCFPYNFNTAGMILPDVKEIFTYMEQQYGDPIHKLKIKCQHCKEQNNRIIRNYGYAASLRSNSITWTSLRSNSTANGSSPSISVGP